MTLQTPESGADTGLPETLAQIVDNLSNDALRLRYVLDAIDMHDAKQASSLVGLCTDLTDALHRNLCNAALRSFEKGAL